MPIANPRIADTSMIASVIKTTLGLKTFAARVGCIWLGKAGDIGGYLPPILAEDCYTSGVKRRDLIVTGEKKDLKCFVCCLKESWIVLLQKLGGPAEPIGLV
jgi:hypothetical protein